MFAEAYTCDENRNCIEDAVQSQVRHDVTAMSLCLSVSLYRCISVSLYLYISVSLYLCISVSLYLCISVSLSLCVSVSLSLCLSVSLFLCLSVSLSLCLSVSLSLCISVSLSLCLSVRLEFEFKVLPTTTVTGGSSGSREGLKGLKTPVGHRGDSASVANITVKDNAYRPTSELVSM